MHQDNYPAETVVGRRVVEDALTALAETERRDLMPATRAIGDDDGIGMLAHGR